MSPTEQPLIDINLVVNPWQAMVVVALIFATMIWPSLSASISSKRIERSITKNNGGNSVVDRFDKLDAKLTALDKRLRRVEHGQRAGAHVGPASPSTGNVEPASANVPGQGRRSRRATSKAAPASD